MKKENIDFLKKLAKKTIDDCTFVKNVDYFNSNSDESILLPSGDEKYYSFWVRDCAMMAESNLIPDETLKKYILIIAAHGQNGSEALFLDNGLIVPPFAIADHINYDGKAVYFPGTYSTGSNQGNGDFGYYPPFCDNYYYVIMVCSYIKQSGDVGILKENVLDLTLEESIEYAFAGYNIDLESDLCVSDSERPTVDWGFVDAIKKSGKLLMASILRYNAAKALQSIFTNNQDKSAYYQSKAEKIRDNIISTFYDSKTGWFFSATGIARQYDVWATAYAVFSGILENEKTLKALYDAYIDKTAVSCGYVRHILTDNDFSSTSAWENTKLSYNTYQNGGYWSTPTGWYAYALFLYNGTTDILADFINHTQKHENEGAPFEWINADTADYSGLHYGTSGVLPYIGVSKILKKTIAN